MAGGVEKGMAQHRSRVRLRGSKGNACTRTLVSVTSPGTHTRRACMHARPDRSRLFVLVFMSGRQAGSLLLPSHTPGSTMPRSARDGSRVVAPSSATVQNGGRRISGLNGVGQNMPLSPPNLTSQHSAPPSQHFGYEPYVHVRTDDRALIPMRIDSKTSVDSAVEAVCQGSVLAASAFQKASASQLFTSTRRSLDSLGSITFPVDFSVLYASQIRTF